MKPLKLSIENINSFRSAQTVDFEKLTAGENIFCISGITGSGKTTIFDSMLLAIYGRNNRGNLAEIINLSANRGRVVFEFEADYNGMRSVFVCDRTISKTGSGSKAMLTQNGEVIAEGNKVSTVMQEIIGLEFDQFTQVALLEQGKFNQFLSSTPGVRANMLSKLLGLEKYKSAQYIAEGKAKQLAHEISVIDSALAVYEERGVNKDNLAKVNADIKALQEKADGLEKEVAKAIENQKAFEADKKRNEVFVSHKKQLDEAAAQAATLKAELAKYTVFNADEHKSKQDALQTLTTGKALLDAKMKQLGELRKDYQTAADAVKRAEEELDKNKSLLALAADYIRENISAGDKCPVCGGEVKGGACGHSADADALQNGLTKSKNATQNIAQLVERRNNLEGEGKKAKEEFDALQREYGAYDDVPAAINALKTAISVMERNRDNIESAQKKYETAAAKEKACAEMLASLGENKYDEKAAQSADQHFKAVDKERADNADALSRKKKECADIEESLPKVLEAYEKRKNLDKRQGTFATLAALLKKYSLFEFVADEYINEFAVIASDILIRLSGGMYMLEYTEKEFYIIDYNFDGQKRKVKSLSGGETFLASISIAIAIMKHISSGKSFEFFFLDEGFGTLHQEAVDITISALKELSRDVTVGVISHVDGIKEGIATRITVTHASQDEGSIISYE